MNPPPPPRHNSTGFSKVIKRYSFKKEAEASQPPSPPNRVQDEIPVYDLAINDLRGWLRLRFPDHNFDGNRVEVKGDKFVIWVPQKLTELEKEAIARLRRVEPQAAEPDY